MTYCADAAIMPSEARVPHRGDNRRRFMTSSSLPQDPLFDLQGKAALVTGASAGLGLHFAHVLADRGAKVTLAARRAEILELGCQSIAEKGGSARSLALDVRDSRSVEAAIEEGGPFDILVNNAGVTATRRALDMSEADWDNVLDINLKGAFLVARAVASSMKAAGKGGAIVNIASILGLRVAGELSAYAASKAGLIQLTKSLALEWARHGIRVNALCPGYIATDLNRDFFASEAGETLIRRIPQRQLGQAGDLDGALLLLCSNAGRYMTGSTVVVDGGHLVSSL
jgi:NAD(P)-dependent dehydrogenase (short-subunit alcohol dehydrogenase family)